MATTIMIDRLREVYWPRFMNRWTSRHVYRARPREFMPHRVQSRRRYDLGRVHFLLLEIQRGKRLEPIEVDNAWCGTLPVGVVVEDGHHRLAASILAGHSTILANVGGLITIREWLAGRRKTCPL